MLIAFAIIVISVTFLLSIRKTKSFSNPLAIYLIFWGFWIIMSFFNLYKLYAVSQITYFILIINILSFSIGFLLISKRRKSHLFNFNLSEKKFNNILFFIEVIIFFILLYYSTKFNLILSSTSILNSRSIVFEQGYLFKSYTQTLLYNYFIYSSVYISIIYRVIKYILKGRITLPFVLSVINVLLFSSIGLGRLILFESILFLLIVFLINKDIRIKNKIKKNDRIKTFKILFLVLFGLVLMTYITAQRTGESFYNFNGLFSWFNFSVGQAFKYFLGSFRALDYFISNNLVNNSGHLFGRATFAGIEEIVNNVFYLLDIRIITANAIMSSFTTEQIVIGHDGQTYLAFYTSISNFYMDGGLPYVIGFSFSFGLFVAFIWNLFNKTPNIYSLMLLVFVVKISLVAQYRWDMTSPSNWIILTVFSVLTHISIKNSQ